MDTRQALDGLRVVDIATLFAGPIAATLLGDFGAEVVKVEHPRGDPVRNHGASKDGQGLWWKVLSRNKRAVSLNLSTVEGQDLFRDLVAGADVLIENFRPGTLERWGLGYDTLREHNPGLLLARFSGFGQFGPYAGRPGFGTLAEAMSGFAAMTGEPDGPPTLPPFGLADGIAGITGAFGIMTALRDRDRTGRGQVLDTSIIEPILAVLGPNATAYDQLGVIPPRTGNRSPNNAPRNTYLTKDERWIAISTSAQSVAERVMRLVGRPEVIDEPWFTSGALRAQHSDLLDEAVATWVRQRTRDEAIAEFERVSAAAAPVYDIADILRDPQFQALRSFIRIPDDDLGSVLMQDVPFRLSETPGRIRWTGRAVGQDNDEVYGALGISPERLRELAGKGVV